MQKFVSFFNLTKIFVVKTLKEELKFVAFVDGKKLSKLEFRMLKEPLKREQKAAIFLM